MIRTRLLLLVLASALIAGCGGSGGGAAGSSTAHARCSYPATAPGATVAKKVKAPPGNPPADLPTSMTIQTSAGEIPVNLDAKEAPCAVNSFVSLARQGYFDKTNCHRLSTQGYFVLQCGDPTGTGRGGPGYSFADELVANDPRLQPCGSEQGDQYCTYNAGTVAMANAGPDTNGSQFFLVYGNSRFPPAYTVLGDMGAAGLKVVKAIAANGIGTANNLGPGDGAPKDPVTITSVS